MSLKLVVMLEWSKVSISYVCWVGGRVISIYKCHSQQWEKIILGPLQYQKISLNIKTFDYLIVGFHTAHGLLIYVYRWAIIDIKLQWIWKFEKVKGKVQLHYPQGVSKNASKGDVKFFNPKYVTIGSGIDQNKKSLSFLPIGQKMLILHWKRAFFDQWVNYLFLSLPEPMVTFLCLKNHTSP